MSEYKLKRTVFDTPIARVIGGPIIVTVRATFSNGEDEIEVSALAATEDATEAAIEETQERALSKCHKNLQRLLMTPEKVKSRDDFLRTLIDSHLAAPAQALKDEKTEAIKEKFSDNPEKESKFLEALNGNATERHQSEINDLMETIGVVPISVLGENPMTLIYAQALISELKYMAKKWETEVDVSVLK